MMDKILIRKERLNISRTIRMAESLYSRIDELADSADISFNTAVNYLLNYAINNADFVVVESD